MELDIAAVRAPLGEDDRVIFAYLYGSYVHSETFEDLDIAVYSTRGVDPFRLSADLKIELSERTGAPPDFFDIRVLNGVLEHGDLFSLLFLKSMFESNELLIDKNFDIRADFIERYGMKYRECEGLIDEVLA